MAETASKANVEEVLHAILTKHGIASLSEYQELVTDLVRWAADACQQTHSSRIEQLLSDFKEIWKLAHRVNSVYSDAHMSKNAQLFEMRGAASKIIDICDKIRRG